MVLLDGLTQNTIAMLLGTDRTDDFQGMEPEHPNCLAVIWPLGEVKRETLDVKRGELTEVPLFLDSAVVEDLAGGKWNGYANRLSGEHGVHWDIIDEVAEASWKCTV